MKKAQKNKSAPKSKIIAKKASAKSIQPKRARSKKIVAKLSAKKSTSVKAKATRRKAQPKNDFTPVEIVPMIHSPKAAAVESSHAFDSTGGLLKKINARFSPRNLFRHQGR